MALKSAKAVSESVLVAASSFVLHQVYHLSFRVVPESWRLWVTTAAFPFILIPYYRLVSFLVADDDVFSGPVISEVIKPLVHGGTAGAVTLVRCLKARFTAADHSKSCDGDSSDEGDKSYVVVAAGGEEEYYGDVDDEVRESRREDGADFPSLETDSKCSDVDSEVLHEEDKEEHSTGGGEEPHRVGEEKAEVETRPNDGVTDEDDQFARCREASGDEGEAEHIHAEDEGWSRPVDAFDGHGESGFVYVVSEEVLEAMNKTRSVAGGE